MFKNTRMTTLVMMVLAMLVAFVAALGIYNSSALRRADESDTLLYRENAVPSAELGEFSRYFYRAWTNLLESTLITDPALRSSALTKIEERIRQTEDRVEALDKSFKNEAIREGWGGMKRAFDPLRSELKWAVGAMRAGQISEVVKSMTTGPMQEHRVVLGQVSDKFVATVLQHAAARAESNTVEAGVAIRNTTILIGFAVAFASIVGFLLYRRMRGLFGQLSSETERLVTAAVEGKLQMRADSKDAYLECQPVMEGFNRVLDAVINPLNVAAKYVESISKGNIPAKITDTYNGDFNNVKNNLNQCIDAVSALVADATMLAKAAVDGKLGTRAEASKHKGDYRKIVQGVNDTLDAVITPVNMCGQYMEQISKGDIPARITVTFNGDFNNVKNSFNQCIDAVNALVTDVTLLSKAAVEGKLATRADASKHHGDYRKIVQGVNDTLDAVIGPLNVAAKYVDSISKGEIPPKITDNYNGDFNTIKDNLNQCI